ncbi:hypothetical protein AVO42_00480 [Thiomicrospira sp. XS5]|nr:hypothetical protein AVO42_00480 [Thiomicrospira sp. XS5]
MIDLFGPDAPEVQAANQPEAFPVLEENWPAIQLFLQCQTQWNYLSGMTIAKTGLNYQAVETVMRLCYADEDPADLFKRVQAIENEVLKAERG